jgi:hypothetical protein
MPLGFKRLRIPRFYGLDVKTNIIDVKDGFSLDCKNVYQNQSWVMSKRPGNSVMFSYDEDDSIEIAEIGAATLSGTKYYFKFVDGDFRYSTTLTGATTTISPSPAIDTSNQIFWEVLDNKLFFVDDTNNLRFFDGSTIKDSVIYERPTVALTTASVSTGYDFTYTVDNGLGESPACATLLLNKGNGATVTIIVQGNTGPQTLVAGDVLRVYSHATGIAAASKLVFEYTWTAADVTAGNKSFNPNSFDDTQPQLYSELGEALNKSAPVLTGITTHYGRLVGWVSEEVHNSKSSNPHSWPDNAASREAFVYSVGAGDGYPIQACASFRESLFVLKKKDVVVFSGVGPDDTGGNAYSFRRLETNGIGCVAPKSARVVGEQGKQFLIYLSHLGFYATTGSAPIRIGETIEPIIQTFSESNLQSACSFFHKKQGFYLCFIGSPSSRTGWALDTREDNGVTVGWVKWGDINPRCVYWDEDRFLFGNYDGICAVERTAGTAADFSDVRFEYFDSSAVNTATDIITLANTYATGDTVVFRGVSGVPAGLTANTTYYLIKITDTTYKVASSLANALSGTAINITGTGTSPMSMISSVAIDAYYTTNWLNFGSTSHVKKLLKPSIMLNALASSVNITMTEAYDWVATFTDPHTISVGSSDAWGTLPWGSFVWGSGANATPRNIATSRRKVRSVRYKFENNIINQDFDLQGLDQEFAYIRNRGNYQSE